MFGRLKADGINVPSWFDGPSAPSSCDVVIERPSKEDDEIKKQETEWSDEEEDEDDSNED